MSIKFCSDGINKCVHLFIWGIERNMPKLSWCPRFLIPLTTSPRSHNKHDSLENLKNSHLASKPLLITSRPSRPPTVQSISPLWGVRTMPLTRLISPVTQLSVRKLIHCNNKETIKALHHWPFCCEPRVIGGFPAQRVNKVSKTVSLSLGKSRQLISGTN